jgi:hypothetical protein
MCAANLPRPAAVSDLAAMTELAATMPAGHHRRPAGTAIRT